MAKLSSINKNEHRKALVVKYAGKFAVLKAIANAEKKIVEIRQQRKKFENEAEFYKKKTLPHEVKKGLADADSDINSQEVFIAEKKKELEVIRAKYDEDKRRFVELISQRPPKR